MNHARGEPRIAYRIFSQQRYHGDFVIVAVQAGLALSHFQNEERVLRANEVDKAHLERAYRSAPFDVKVQIASHLNDSEKLQKLSQRAHKESNLDRAYCLWVAGRGNLEGEYLDGIRTRLIDDAIENHSGCMAFLDDSDTVGLTMAYDALMQSEKPERTDNLSYAYKIALKLGDEERTQRAREAMVTISPEWALRNFTNRTRGTDEKGVDYALGVVAREHGVEQGALRPLVDKYQPV